MRKVAVLIVVQFSVAFSIYAQQPDSVKTFVDSALAIMQRNSIHASELDWSKIRDSVALMIARSTNYADVQPALRYAFNQLGDKHGWLVFNGEDYRNPSFSPDTSRISADIKQVALKGPRVYAGRVDEKYTYLSIPFFGGQTPEAMKKFGQQLQDSLCRYTNDKTKGFIIDLRLNAGGNMFAMLAGINNLIGPGVIGKSVDQYGKEFTVTEVKDNGIAINDSLFTSIDRICGDYSGLPVAILVGPVTASAGECIAVAFAGRNKSILIGENTAGYVTANNGWYLPGKNNGIVLAVEYIRDANGVEYKENVKPVIRVIGGDHFFDRNNDEKIKAALRWLKKQS